MPQYNYKCESCGDISTRFKTISKRKEPEKEPCDKCGSEIRQTIIHTIYSVIDNVRLGRVKPPIEFQERLQQIHNKSPGSTINDSSTITQIRK